MLQKPVNVLAQTNGMKDEFIAGSNVLIEDSIRANSNAVQAGLACQFRGAGRVRVGS
jgi:hypothetical protein